MSKMLFALSVYVAGMVLIFLPPALGQGEYEFDLSEIEKEIEKKPSNGERAMPLTPLPLFYGPKTLIILQRPWRAIMLSIADLIKSFDVPLKTPGLHTGDSAGHGIHQRRFW